MKAIQRLFWPVALLLLLNTPVYAQAELAPFDQPEQRELYQDLLAELRCLVCQNQNLADSNADLAGICVPKPNKWYVPETAGKKWLNTWSSDTAISSCTGHHSKILLLLCGYPRSCY